MITVDAFTGSISQLAQDLAPRLVEIRRELHRHPELSGAEFWTTERLTGWLTEAGIVILPLSLKTGVVAEVRGAPPGPVVAVRADIDALPVLEETGLPFASEFPGRMHACGHDFHMATVLGAALILQQKAQELRGTVRFLFQPAEEITAGARDLIHAGAMEGVRSVFGLHNKPDLPAGTVGIGYGPLMAATDMFTITVHGKGGHAAIPDASIDPVVAGSAMVMAMQTAVSRSISPFDPAVVSITSFQAGSAHNIIPPTATLLGTIRSFDPSVREKLKKTMTRIVHEVAAAHGATADFAVLEGTPAVSNDPAMTDLMRRAALDLGMPITLAERSMGGEDFAEYQQLAPGCFIWLGTGSPYGWHHPGFLVDEAVIHQGAALMARVAALALKAPLG